MPRQRLSHLRRDAGPGQPRDEPVPQAVEIGVESVVVAVAQKIGFNPPLKFLWILKSGIGWRQRLMRLVIVRNQGSLQSPTREPFPQARKGLFDWISHSSTVEMPDFCRHQKMLPWPSDKCTSRNGLCNTNVTLEDSDDENNVHHGDYAKKDRP